MRKVSIKVVTKDGYETTQWSVNIEIDFVKNVLVEWNGIYCNEYPLSQFKSIRVMEEEK